MALTDEQVSLATKRGRAAQSKFPALVGAKFDRRSCKVILYLSSGLELAFPPQSVQGLEHAEALDLELIEVSPSGLGVWFPKLDVDLYVPALLNGFLGSASWMAGEIGRLGGVKSSKAKAEASRKNGALGGRPAKKLNEV